jgi:hypothetical protein
VSTQPDEQWWDVGRDEFGRLVRLKFGKDYAGRRSWSLHREAASQRDESIVVYNLSAEVLIAMGEVAKAYRR